MLIRKKMLKNNILITFLFSFIVSSIASADYRDGQDAYASGNYQAAILEWIPIAKDGDAKAQYNLGWMRANGKGTAQDFQEAVDWYTKSAKQGYIHAQYNLANLYLRGQGVTQNDKLAFSWFLKAAEQGDAPAQYNLGRMYLLGTGADKNYYEARFWIKQALENNDEYIEILAQQVWDDFTLGGY
jgi:TPR repeat protein